ncbi:MAG: hypothetical protein JXB13_14865 [Phycisphaerae bacterium]|nr:hypothetical protein [Phycisphaerae bacterium]
MKRSKRFLTGALVLTAVLAWAGGALAADFIVESQPEPDGHNWDQYSETGAWADSSAKSTAAGLGAGNSRYCGLAFAEGKYAHWNFPCPDTGDYEVFVTWGDSTNGSDAMVFNVWYDVAGTPTMSADFLMDQHQFTGDGPNVWHSLGTYSMLGGTSYEVTLTYKPSLGGAYVSTHGNRLMSDSVKWSRACWCADVPDVGVQTPVAAGHTVVTVTGVDASATAVTVYATVGGETTQIGTNPAPGGASTVPVTVTALVDGQRIDATQTMVVCDPPESQESCVWLTGPIVGDCEQIADVSMSDDPLVTDLTSVTVEGVASDAEAVTVYATTAGESTEIGKNSAPGGASSVAVTVTALVSGDIISATQTRSGLEGCVRQTGPVVDSCEQVALVAICGLLLDGVEAVTVKNVDPSAALVTVYATVGVETTIIGSIDPEAATVVDVPVSALVLDDEISATQTLMVSGTPIEGCLSAGKTVGSVAMLADFDDGVTEVTHPNPGDYGIWYQAAVSAGGNALAAALFGSPAMRHLDSGYTNGIYCIFEAVVPSTATYHLQADMLVDESTGNINAFSQYQFGTRVNGVHRSKFGNLPGISGTPVGEGVGNYLGLTVNQDGLGIESESQVVYTSAIEAGGCDDLLVAYSVDVGTWQSGGAWGGTSMLIDNLLLNDGPPPVTCGQVPKALVRTGPLEAGTTTVMVESLDPSATAVTVYAVYADETSTQLGTANPAGAGSMNVTVNPPLVEGDLIVATQTMVISDITMEGCIQTDPTAVGVAVVGSGENTPIPASIGIREDITMTGPIGAPGATAGPIEWLYATGKVVEDRPDGGQVLEPQPTWQTITFDPLSDPIWPYSDWAGADGTLDGAYGVLEHLALAIDTSDPNTGRYVLYIDEVKSGTTTVTDFEGLTLGEVALFQTPTMSGSTSQNLLDGDPEGDNVNLSEVTDEEASNGTQSCKIVLQFKDQDARRWVRLATNTGELAPNQVPNPQVDLTLPLTMKVLFYGITCNTPFDWDDDGDVDQVDFGKFQKCYTGLAGGILPGCECFNQNPEPPGDPGADNDVDQDDLSMFEDCASGPGVASPCYP